MTDQDVLAAQNGQPLASSTVAAPAVTEKPHPNNVTVLPTPTTATKPQPQPDAKVVELPMAAVIEDGLRLRGPDAKVVDAYADAVLAGDQLPPLDVYRIEDPGHALHGKLVLAGGRHRFAALSKLAAEAARAEKKASSKNSLAREHENKVRAKVHTGTYEQALLFGIHDNARHGARLRGTNLRLAVARVLELPSMASRSNRQLAALVGCSAMQFGRVRSQIESAPRERDAVVQTADGRTMRTHNLGKQKRQPEWVTLEPEVDGLSKGDVQLRYSSAADPALVLLALEQAAREVKSAVERQRNGRLAEVPREQRSTALAVVKKGETVSNAVALVKPLQKSNGWPTDEQRLKTIERLMKEATPLADRLQHKLHGIVQNARKVGVEKIGGLGGFRVGVELTALRTTLDELKGMFP